MYGMALDRKERFELRLSKREADTIRRLAAKAGVSAADYVRQRLAVKPDAEHEAARQAKLEQLAFASAAEMLGRPGVSSVGVFATPPGPRSVPTAARDAGPQPLASSILEAPTIGNVVVQGFPRHVDEAARAAVEGRFRGALATWIHRGSPPGEV
jgi:hypothetical protein